MLPLLETKIRIPPVRAGLVARERLMALVRQGLELSLTLVVAPAGFGKTTLVAAAVHPTPERAVAWLTCDADDNAPDRFWQALLAAIDRALPGQTATAWALLQGMPPTPPQAVMTAVLNTLHAAPTTLIVVLDDFHLIDSEALLTALDLALRDVHPRLRLVITTRVEPPLGLARLRVRGQLQEVDAEALRFQLPEAAQFFSDTMGVALDPETVAVLGSRTEGWAAGLQLAALSLRGRADVRPFVSAFNGSHRLVVDYLIDEVLAQQSPAVQAFLLRTSVAQRLCGALCDALVSDTGAVPEPGTAMLDRLDRQNLFLSRLDESGQWYRYHRLFADALQTRLGQTEPDLLAELHARAAHWWLAHDAWAEAVTHARASGRMGLWADTLEAASGPLLISGQPGLLWESYQALPTAEIEQRPGLHLFAGWAALLTGQLDRVEPHLRQIEPTIQQMTAHEGLVLRGQLAAIRSYRLALISDIAAALATAQPAVDGMTAYDPLMRAVIGMNLGAVHFMAGQIRPALSLLADAEDAARAIGNPWLALTAYGFLAQIWWEQGNLQRAEAAFRAVQASAHSAPNQQLNARFALASLAYERNQLDAADVEATEVQALANQGGLPEWRALSALARARVAWARGGIIEARALVDQAASLEALVPAPTRVVVAGMRLRQALVMGATADDPALAAAAANSDGFHSLQQKSLYLAAAHALIRATRWAEARALLEAMLAIAERSGRAVAEVEIRIMLALVRRAQREPDAARTLVAHAVAGAAERGLVRVFVDLGPGARALLEDQPPSAERQRLLDAFPGPTPQGLIEPLHERELEVLRLVAAGQSNAQIAATLTLALGTVKKHLNNIFGKLEATSRTQAVARARELGLLAADK